MEIAAFVKSIFDFVKGVLPSLASVLPWSKEHWHTRLKSAEALASIQNDEALQRFGEIEVRRMHFRLLTKFDRREEFGPLIRAHTALGGSDEAWRSLHAVRPYLEKREPSKVIHVRERTRRDWYMLLVVLAAGAIFTAIGRWIQKPFQIAFDSLLSQPQSIQNVLTMVFFSAVLAYCVIVCCASVMFAMRMFFQAPLVKRRLIEGYAKSRSEELSAEIAPRP